MSIHAETLPDVALLRYYANRPDCYTDCYSTTLMFNVSLADFITAFYTTPIFKAERLVLRVGARTKVTDADVVALADGKTEEFAVWTVEDRTATQILLEDKSGSTRSWLMVASQGTGTKLYFGSALVPAVEDGPLPLLARLMILPHKLYSRKLLSAAAKQFS